MINNISRFGFDIGNVTLQYDTDSPHNRQDWRDGFELPQKYVDGALEMIPRIVDILGHENVFAISKCGTAMQEQTLRVFDSTNFYENTGVKPENIIFCKRRSQKALIAEGLGLNCYVDDRSDILQLMTSVSLKILFARPGMESEVVKVKDKTGLRIASGWDEVWDIVSDEKSPQQS